MIFFFFKLVFIYLFMGAGAHVCHSKYVAARDDLLEVALNFYHVGSGY